MANCLKVVPVTYYITIQWPQFPWSNGQFYYGFQIPSSTRCTPNVLHPQMLKVIDPIRVTELRSYITLSLCPMSHIKKTGKQSLNFCYLSFSTLVADLWLFPDKISQAK